MPELRYLSHQLHNWVTVDKEKEGPPRTLPQDDLFDFLQLYYLGTVLCMHTTTTVYTVVDQVNSHLMSSLSAFEKAVPSALVATQW